MMNSKLCLSKPSYQIGSSFSVVWWPTKSLSGTLPDERNSETVTVQRSLNVAFGLVL